MGIAAVVKAKKFLLAGVAVAVVTATLLLVVMTSNVEAMKRASPKTSLAHNKRADHSFTFLESESEKQEAINHMSQAIRFKTISLDPAESPSDTSEYDGQFEAFYKFLKESYPLVFNQRSLVPIAFEEGNPSNKPHGILLKWQGTNPSLLPVLLASHMDVVPVDEESRSLWKFDPWNGTIADGFIWGRGTLDDKMGVIGILEAVEALLKEDFQPERTMYIAFGQDEEISGKRGAVKMAKYLNEQGVKLEYVLDEGGLILESVLESIKKPVALIGLAEKGYATIKLSVSGPGGHSSMPESETPIGIIATAVTRLESNQMPASLSGPTKEMLEHLAPEMPWFERFMFSNLWLFSGAVEQEMLKSPRSAASIRTTTAPTIIKGGVKENVLPQSVVVYINFRIAPHDSLESVVDHVIKVINDERITVELLPDTASEPSPVSPTDSLGWKIIKDTTNQLFPDTVVAPYLSIGATDSRHYSELTQNIYRFAPYQLSGADLERMHGVDERISVQNFLNCVSFYGTLILNSQKAQMLD